MQKKNKPFLLESLEEDVAFISNGFALKKIYFGKMIKLNKSLLAYTNHEILNRDEFRFKKERKKELINKRNSFIFVWII